MRCAAVVLSAWGHASEGGSPVRLCSWGADVRTNNGKFLARSS